MDKTKDYVPVEYDELIDALPLFILILLVFIWHLILVCFVCASPTPSPFPLSVFDPPHRPHSKAVHYSFSCRMPLDGHRPNSWTRICFYNLSFILSPFLFLLIFVCIYIPLRCLIFACVLSPAINKPTQQRREVTMRAGKSAELNKKHKTETISETKQQKQKPNRKEKMVALWEEEFSEGTVSTFRIRQSFNKLTSKSAELTRNRSEVARIKSGSFAEWAELDGTSKGSTSPLLSLLFISWHVTHSTCHDGSSKRQ